VQLNSSQLTKALSVLRNGLKLRVWEVALMWLTQLKTMSWSEQTLNGAKAYIYVIIKITLRFDEPKEKLT